MKFLAFKNWRRFQHYTQRKAPWVKLYSDVLDDSVFLGMSEVAQAHLLKLWALIASMGHPLPNNVALLAGKIGAKRLRIEELIAANFVYPTDNPNEGCEQNASKDASNVLAKSEQNAMDSTRAREEVRSKKLEVRSQKSETKATTDTSPKANTISERVRPALEGAPAAPQRSGDGKPTPIGDTMAKLVPSTSPEAA